MLTGDNKGFMMTGNHGSIGTGEEEDEDDSFIQPWMVDTREGDSRVEHNQHLLDHMSSAVRQLIDDVASLTSDTQRIEHKVDSLLGSYDGYRIGKTLPVTNRVYEPLRTCLSCLPSATSRRKICSRTSNKIPLIFSMIFFLAIIIFTCQEFWISSPGINERDGAAADDAAGMQDTAQQDENNTKDASLHAANCALHIFKFSHYYSQKKNFDLCKRDNLTGSAPANQSYLIYHQQKMKLCWGISRRATIVYNRVPKTASRTVEDVFLALSYGRFNLIKSHVYLHYKLSEVEQSMQAQQLNLQKGPWVFSRHMYYVEFERYGFSSPHYINLIRDPVDRYVSLYYFQLFDSAYSYMYTQEEKNMTLDDCIRKNHPLCHGDQDYIHDTILFFCGHDEKCFESIPRALGMAKSRVLWGYTLVGITEDLSTFFLLLQTIFHDLFKGAWEFYRQNDQQKHLKYKTSRHKRISQETERILKKKLKYEYEFYNFVKAYFYELACHVVHVNEKYKKQLNLGVDMWQSLRSKGQRYGINKFLRINQKKRN